MKDTSLFDHLADRKTVDNSYLQRYSTRYIGRRPWKGRVVLEADWNGRILRELQHPDHNHDGIRLRNGHVLLICLAPLPPDLIPKIQGGLPHTEHDGEIYADYLVEMTTKGQIVWEWHAWEHLDPQTDCITAVQDLRDEWTHANGLAELPNGDIVVSFRQIPRLSSLIGRPAKLSGNSQPLHYPPTCADAAGEWQSFAVRQRATPLGSQHAVFAGTRSRITDQANCLEIPRAAGI